MPRKPAVRKKPTALWPYHHWNMASCTPPQAMYDFEPNTDTGSAGLLPRCRTAIVTMKAR
jgi:hypothetical protein